MLFEATYRQSSALLTRGLDPVAFLASRLDRPTVEAPGTMGDDQLFTGTLRQPQLLRRLLLGLHAVVSSRFDWIAYADYLDPVITVDPRTVRLEAFSGCAGVYARVDLLTAAFDDAWFGPAGTTNVDLNAPFVRQLVNLRPDRECRLEVGTECLRLETHRGEAIERKVPLPKRWLRGFLQVQAAQARARPVVELSAGSARRLIHAIPSRSSTPHVVDFRGRAPRLLRRAPHGSGADVLELAGGHRLRLLADVLPGMRGVRVFRVEQTGASIWVCEGDGARLTLAVSGGVNRGFSGEGDALLHLSGGSASDDTDESEAVRQALEARHEASVEQLMIERRSTASETRRHLDQLAGRGLVGFDRASGRYFYRVLPYGEALPVPPRLRGARELIDRGLVEVEERTALSGGELLRGWVRGQGGDYRVEASIRSGRLTDGRCTCAWVRRHGLERGPCKHLLALRLRAESEDD